MEKQLIPPVLIETPRLVLRHFYQGDAQGVFEFNQHPEMLKYIPGDPILSSVAEAAQIIENVWLNEYRQYGYARYAVILKGEINPIGFAGFKFEPEFGFPDLGYRIAPPFWGKGLISEAVDALLVYGKTTLELNKIVAIAAVDNAAYNRILQKFNFKQTNTLVEHGMPHYFYEKLL